MEDKHIECLFILMLSEILQITKNKIKSPELEVFTFMCSPFVVKDEATEKVFKEDEQFNLKSGRGMIYNCSKYLILAIYLY